MSALSSYSLFEVGVASVANGVFAALALIDFSADVYVWGDLPSRGAFLSAYYAFRHGERVLTGAIAVSSAALPFILYLAVTEDVLGLWRRPRHLSRHQVGVAMLAALVAVVAFNLAVQRPAEAVLAASPRGSAAWAAAAHLSPLPEPPLVLVLRVRRRVLPQHVVHELAGRRKRGATKKVGAAGGAVLRLGARRTAVQHRSVPLAQTTSWRAGPMHGAGWDGLKALGTLVCAPPPYGHQSL